MSQIPIGKMEVSCPHCQKLLMVPTLAAGKIARCPHCRGTFSITSNDQLGSESESQIASNVVLQSFYCRDCEIEFESPPDETHQEQALCPSCNQICMTTVFELEEQQRHQSEAAFFSILGMVSTSYRQSANDGSQQRNEFVTIVSYEALADAEADAAALAEHGIRATLAVDRPKGSADSCGANDASFIELRVAPEDMVRATAILHSLDPVQKADSTNDPLSDVSFECEDCGKSISFPGHRRGGVETCPYCHNYVDVPE